MTKSKQLTAACRKAIEVLLDEKYTVSNIAGKLKVHKSTISREVKRCKFLGRYDAQIAQWNYESNRKNVGKKKKLNFTHTQQYVVERVMFGWSPEQISGRMKFENRPDYVCKETIYSFIYSDTQSKTDKLFQYLRQGKRRRTKHHARKTFQVKIDNKISIHDRPFIVKERSQFGHFEADSVIYPNLKVINTINELKTGLVFFNLLSRKTALLTAEALVNTLNPLKALSLTVDNGCEFAYHQQITKQTGIPIYFCDPYCSNQRGSNENNNGLLRRYLPKRRNIEDLTQEELNDIAWELNNRPRKRLGYLSPIEFYEKNVLNLNVETSVAFRTGI